MTQLANQLGFGWNSCDLLLLLLTRERAKQKADALQHKTEALAKSLEQAEQEKRLLEAELNALRLQADPEGTCPSCQPLPNVEQVLCLPAPPSRPQAHLACAKAHVKTHSTANHSARPKP